MAAEEDAAAFAASQRRAEALLDYGARIRVPYRLTDQFTEALSKGPDDAAALQEATGTAHGRHVRRRPRGAGLDGSKQSGEFVVGRFGGKRTALDGERLDAFPK